MKLYYTEEEVQQKFPDLIHNPYIVQQVYQDLLTEINSQIDVEVKTVYYLKHSIGFCGRLYKHIWVLEGFRNYVFDLHNIKYTGGECE